MAVSPSVRSRLATAARWLVPSAVCASAGALAAGALDAIDGALLVATGFAALLAWPVLFAASVLARGIYALWQPAALADALTDDSGGAPRLAGWVSFLFVALLALLWAMFQGTWLIAALTAFKPLTLSFAQPILAAGVVLVLVALSRPTVRLFARIARAVDHRWRRRGRRSLLRPRAIFASTGALTAAALYLLWRLVVRPRIGAFDTSILVAPGAALAATAAAHLLWNTARRRARAIAGGACALAAAAAISAALVATRTHPSLALEVWGEQPLGGVAIELWFDLDAIRANLPLSEFRPAERPGAAHPDILLITIDTVRADRTPPYGGSAEMPVLRELGARGAVFQRAFAPSNVTRRSIPSMITGLHPHRVRGRVVGWALRIDPRHVVVAERLRAGGYDTAGFMCCDSFWGTRARTGLQRGLAHLVIEPNGARLGAAAAAWLAERERRPSRAPLFLWMHLIEPHNWTSENASGATGDDGRRIQYERSLARADAALRPIVDAFRERAPERAPIYIVTADHGEALGEHGVPYHSTDLYNSNLHVPFVVAGPGIARQSILEPVSLTDLTPTLLELAGFVPPPLDGRSVADLAQGRRTPDPESGLAFSAMIRDRSNRGGITALVRGTWKLIDNLGTLELYDLRSDLGERVNLLSQRPEITQSLLPLLRERQALGKRSPF